MTLHPGVLALHVASAVCLFLVLLGCAVGVGILRHWEPGSATGRQISLERRTHLAASAVALALGIQAASAFLFLFTADDLHRLIVGAMCATGTLNANPLGWYSLALKTLLLFASSLWILLNRVDSLSESAPLVRTKYRFLLALAPLVVLDALLQALYFSGIRPDVITSCCGSLFTRGGQGVASVLSSLPPLPSLVAFGGGAVLFLFTGAWRLRRRSAAAGFLFAAAAAFFFPLTLVSIVSVFALYFYESPVHHCPFDLLQGSSGIAGYLIYGLLFAATLFGLAVGLFEPLRRDPGLAPIVEGRQARWTAWSLAAFASLVVLLTWKPLFGDFRLLPYR